MSNPEVFKLFYGGVSYAVKLFIQNKSYSATIYKRSEAGEARGEIAGKYSFSRPPRILTSLRFFQMPNNSPDDCLKLSNNANFKLKECFTKTGSSLASESE